MQGELKGVLGHNWKISDLSSNYRCGESRCIGDKVYVHDETRPPSLAQIVAVDFKGNYVVQFLDGELQGRVGGHWLEENLAKTSGCGLTYCVTDQAYVQNSRVRIVGIQKNLKYILYFYDGELTGRYGFDWTDRHLSRPR